jgi:cysteine desulfurase
MSLSAHKLYGPKGVGALIVDKAVDMEPLLHGGGQERDRRGGTENLASIVGFGKAAELARVELPARRRHVVEQRDYFESRLRQVLPEAVFFAEGAERLGNTIFLAIPGLEGQTLIMALDRSGIEVSSGSACGSEHSEPSPVLKAMGVARETALGAVRISIGKDNTMQDMDLLISALESQVRQLRNMAASTGW